MFLKKKFSKFEWYRYLLIKFRFRFSPYIYFSSMKIIHYITVTQKIIVHSNES